MENAKNTESDAWLIRASRGDPELYALLQKQDSLFAEGAERGGAHRNEDLKAASEQLAQQIMQRQAELGIDPLTGPDNP